MECGGDCLCLELKARQWAHVHLQRYGIRVFLICVGSGLLSVLFVLDAILLGRFLFAG